MNLSRALIHPVSEICLSLVTQNLIYVKHIEPNIPKEESCTPASLYTVPETASGDICSSLSFFLYLSFFPPAINAAMNHTSL